MTPYTQFSKFSFSTLFVQPEAALYTTMSSDENKSENKGHSSSGNKDVQGLIHEINELTFQTRLWRIGAVVGVLLIISLFILSTWNHVSAEFPRNDQELQTMLSKYQEDAEPLLNKVQGEIKKAAKESTDEAMKQLKLVWENKGGEVLGIAAQELDTLVRSVPQNAISGYNNTLNDVLSKRIEGIKLPEGGSGKIDSGKLAKIINEGLLASSTNRTGDIIAVMFEPHIMELSSMSNHLNQIYDKEYGAMASRERQFTLSMALTLMERVNIQLREAEESLRQHQKATKDANKANDGDN